MYKKGTILIITLLFTPFVNGQFLNTIGSVYFQFQSLIDWAVYFSLFITAVVPHIIKIFGENENHKTGLIIGIILSLVFSVSMMVLAARYSIRLIDIWFIAVPLLGISLLNITRDFLPKNEEKSSLLLIPLGITITFAFIALIFPQATVYFPFYYLKGKPQLTASILVIASLAAIAIKTGIKEKIDKELENKREKDPKYKKIKNVVIRINKKQLVRGESAELKCIVANYDYDDVNLEFIWTADFPIDDSRKSSVNISWESVSPKKTVVKKINITVKNINTRQKRSDSVRITFIGDSREDETLAKIKITNPRIRKRFKAGTRIPFKCKILAYNPEKIKKRKIKFEWFLTPGHILVTSENFDRLSKSVLGTGRTIPFGKIPEENPGEYTIITSAFHENLLIAVDSYTITILPKTELKRIFSGLKEKAGDLTEEVKEDIKDITGSFTVYAGGKRRKVILTGDKETNKRIKNAIKYLKKTGKLDEWGKQNPKEKIIDLRGKV